MHAHHFLTVALESHKARFLDQFRLAYTSMICLQFVQRSRFRCMQMIQLYKRTAALNKVSDRLSFFPYS